MKTIATYLLSAYLLPSALFAQPVLSKDEFYSTGQVIQMINCNPGTVNAGAAGAGETWDFSSLAATGTSTTSILHDTSTIFTTSSLMEVMPDGTIAYLQESNTDSYINGSSAPGTGVITYYTNYDASKRPITYNTVFNDSFKINIPSTSTYGTGVLTEIGDAYGSLVLPSGSYPYVLRVRKILLEYDTIVAAPSFTETISYLWFDTTHTAPLLRIDSVIGTSSSSQSVMYLSATSGVSNFNAAQKVYSGYLDNSGHLVVNGFDAGKSYGVILYNIIGNKVFTEDFMANDHSQSFDIARVLSPGIYMVNITAKNEPAENAQVIKVVKTN